MVAAIGLASVSSGELMQDNRRNGLISVRVGPLTTRRNTHVPVGLAVLTPLPETAERTVDGLTLQGGSHDGPARRWSPWLVAAGAAGAGAAKRYGSSGGGADRAGFGAADGDG